jgi:hypothetical protein
LVRKIKGRDESERLDRDKNVISKWILEKQVGWVWIGLIWLRIERGSGSCEHCINIGFHKRGEKS